MIFEKWFEGCESVYQRIYEFAPTTVTILYFVITPYIGYRIGLWAEFKGADENTHIIFPILAPLVIPLAIMIFIGVTGGILYLGEAFVEEMKQVGSKLKSKSEKEDESPKLFRYTTEQTLWLTKVYKDIPFVQKNLQDNEFNVITRLIKDNNEYYNGDDKLLLNYIREKWIAYNNGKY